MSGITAFINNRVLGAKALTVTSLPNAVAYANSLVIFNGILYYSNGTVWINLVTSPSYAEAASLPALPNNDYPSGFVFKNTANGNFYISDNAGANWVKVSDDKPYLQVPNTAFVDKIIPTVTEVQTWVNANLNADQKRYSKLYSIENTIDPLGFNINTSIVISLVHLGASNLNLSSVTINGVATAINLDIEDTANVINPILLDYANCESAKTIIQNAFTAIGVSSIVEIYASSSTAISIYVLTKGSATHNVFFTYTKDGGSTFTSTGTSTSISDRPMNVGSDADNPDHTWEVVDGVVRKLYSRPYVASTYYIETSLPVGRKAYGQVGNVNRPFSSTSEALLYLGLTEFPSNSNIIYKDKSNSSTATGTHILSGSGSLKVNCNSVPNTFIVRFVGNSRTVIINDPGPGSVYLKVANSISSSNLSIKNTTKSGTSGLSFYNLFDQNGSATRVDISGASATINAHCYGTIIYSVNVAHLGNGFIIANEFSSFNLSSFGQGADAFSPNIVANDFANFKMNCSVFGGILLFNENSSFVLNASVIDASSGITLNTDESIYINASVIYQEIRITKTTTTPSTLKPRYNVKADFVNLDATINKLLVDYTTNNIRDFIVNYEFNNATNINMFKATVATTGVQGIEVNYVFNEITFTTTSCFSWEGQLIDSKIRYRGLRCTYIGSSAVNVVYYDNQLTVGTGNEISFDTDFYCPDLAALSRIRLKTGLVDKFRFHGKIWMPNATNLFYTECYASGTYIEISGITKCNTTLLYEASEETFPIVLLKDLLFLFVVITGNKEIYDVGGMGQMVLIQNAATNKTLPSSSIGGYAGGTIIRATEYQDVKFV